MLGHEDSKTTTKYYTKVRESSLQEAKRIMDAQHQSCDKLAFSITGLEAMKRKDFVDNPPPEMRQSM